MNATLIMAFILILIVVATVITKKLPFNFVLFIAPVLCALILGHSIEETSTFIVEQLASMMKSAGFMLLFAFLYFQMLTEAGVFDTIVSAITTKLGNKMNVIVIMVLTTLIGGFSILTGNFTPAYLITFPLMVPLYKKFDFDREAAFIIAQTAMSAMCFIPWGIGMARGQQTEKKKKPIKYFDYSLLFLIIFLLCFGLVMLYSTSSYAGSNKFGDASYFVKKQLFATGLGIVGMYIVSKIPYRFWMKVSSMAYLAAIVLCTAVIFIGTEANGQARWLKIGPLSFQPSRRTSIVISAL